MGRPRKDSALDEISASDIVRARNIVSQMDAELKEPVDEYDCFGNSYARKCGYLEVKIEALMALLRMI